ncbi:MAG: type I secretion system permease/ATPase [Aaplasma endosymbiont of Hyalomma asiaticum]
MKELKKSVLYQTLEKCKSVFWFVFWFSSAINILALFLPLYTSQVLDRVLSSGSASTLMMLSIVTLSALICSSLLDVCRSLTMAKVADWIDREATPDLIVRAISLTSVKGSTSSGEVIRDLGTVKSFITGFGIFSLFDMPWAVVYLAAIFMIHPVTGCIAIVGIVTLVLMAIWNEVSTKKVMQESSEENVRNIGYIDVASRNAEVVEAMGMIRHIVTEWSARNDQNRALQIKSQSRSNTIMGVTKFTRSVLQISVIGVGALLAINGLKTAGGIIAASILMGRALAPFEASINTWKMLQSARISYRRLQSLLLAAPRREQAMTLPVPQGRVMMERVFFTPYGGVKPTIKGVSFSVEPGSSIGIIGASASGKSTLVKLLVGVWKPISGVVRLDGADVYTWNREDFGKYVGYLPQDVELFNASVKTNIARMVSDPDPEKVIKAATIAGIHEMILQLPNGYDTIVGNGGVVLSGGQKQMLGLARAFYGDIKLLVLDEPNANIDGRAEVCLVQALMYAKRMAITTFVVTHKMQLLNAVDQVIIMDDGMMSAMGNRDEIMKMAVKSPSASSPSSRQSPAEVAKVTDGGVSNITKGEGDAEIEAAKVKPVDTKAPEIPSKAQEDSDCPSSSTCEKQDIAAQEREKIAKGDGVASETAEIGSPEVTSKAEEDSSDFSGTTCETPIVYVRGKAKDNTDQAIDVVAYKGDMSTEKAEKGSVPRKPVRSAVSGSRGVTTRKPMESSHRKTKASTLSSLSNKRLGSSSRRPRSIGTTVRADSSNGNFNEGKKHYRVRGNSKTHYGITKRKGRDNSVGERTQDE